MSAGSRAQDGGQGTSRDRLTAGEIVDVLWLARQVEERGGTLASPPVPPGADGGSGPGEAAPVEAPPSRPVPPPATDGAEPQVSPSGRPAGAHTAGRPAPTGGTDSPGERPGPRAAAHGDVLALSRALRPLRLAHSSRARLQLDEEATARRAVEDGLWLPVERRAPERPWAEATVVVDDSPSMLLWRRTAADLVRVLGATGAFTDVRTVQLSTGDGPDGAPQRDGRGRPLLHRRGVPVSPQRLAAPSGRGIVLVLTDGVGRAWREGSVEPLLHQWGSRQPVAIVHVLPYPRWDLTGVRAAPLRLRSFRGAVHNTALGWSAAGDPSPRRGGPRGPGAFGLSAGPGDEGRPVPVPVIELTQRSLAAWASVVADRHGSGTATLPVMLAAAAPSVEPEREPGPEPAPEEIVRQARAALPRAEFQLAVWFAAAPLTLDAAQHVQRELSREPAPHRIGALLASGLLRLVPSASAPDGWELDFPPGVREHLLGLGSRRETLRVLKLAAAMAPAGPDRPAGLAYLQAVVDGGQEAYAEVTAENAASYRLASTVLRALSGPFLRSARSLEASLDAFEAGASAGSGSGDVTVTAGEGSAAAAVVGVDPVAGPLAATATATATAEEHTAGDEAGPGALLTPTVWNAVPPRNPYFTGRAAELEATRAHLAAPGALPLVLLGMGGVGKTQTATEYVHRYAGDYDLVWWIPAADTARIAAALTDLAAALRLPAPPPGAGPRAAVPAVLEALRAGQIRKRWLLVLDDAEDPDAVRAMLPAGGPGGVLMTARNRTWAKVARSLPIDVLSGPEGVDLLLHRSPHLDVRDAGTLAELLGGLPLALASAADWIRETGMDAADYIRLFKAASERILREEDTPDYGTSVAAAVQRSVDHAARGEPLAVDLLHVLSHLASAPVPFTFFGSPASAEPHPVPDWSGARLVGDALATARAVREAVRHALLKVDQRAHTVELHRLVSAVVRQSMSPEQSRASGLLAAHLLAGCLPGPLLTPHLLTPFALRPPSPALRSAVLLQLAWLAEHGPAADGERLARAAREAWREEPGVDAGFWLAELAPYLPSGPDAG